jgi:hypothetical protein
MNWRLRLTYLVGDALAWPGELLAFSFFGRWKPVFYVAWWVRAPGDHLRCWCNRRAGVCNGPP